MIPVARLYPPMGITMLEMVRAAVMTAQAAAVTVVLNPVLAQPHLGLVPTLTVQHPLSLLMVIQSLDGSSSMIGSPVCKCTRHKQKSSGHCHPSSTSHSRTPTTGSQAITIVDDKDQSPSPKCHHGSCTHKKHKKHEHNSPSCSLSLEKQCLSHSSRKKSSSKAASAAHKGSLTSKSPDSAQSVVTASPSGTSSSRACKASGGPQFASSGSFKVMPITNRIKQHKGAHYIRPYHHRDNLYASALSSSLGASSGERSCHHLYLSSQRHLLHPTHPKWIYVLVDAFTDSPMLQAEWGLCPLAWRFLFQLPLKIWTSHATNETA